MSFCEVYRSIYPTELEQLSRANHIVALSCMFGKEVTTSLGEWPKLHNGEYVRRTLRNFTDSMKEPKVSQQAERFYKDRSVEPRKELVLSYPFFSNGLINPDDNSGGPARELDPNGEFWLDGQYGFCLGVKYPSMQTPLWLAATSFAAYPDASSPFYLRIPYIVQIQSGYYRKGEPELHQIVQSELRNIMWEQLMIDLVVRWAAEYSKVPIVALRPASRNPYCSFKVLVEPGYIMGAERGKIRYDYSAERYGFTKIYNGDYFYYI